MVVGVGAKQGVGAAVSRRFSEEGRMIIASRARPGPSK
jgi:NAD(P)-dependent dehydrogenase (short-subunit alcohol dehydrogenase family)